VGRTKKWPGNTGFPGHLVIPQQEAWELGIVRKNTFP